MKRPAVTASLSRTVERIACNTDESINNERECNVDQASRALLVIIIQLCFALDDAMQHGRIEWMIGYFVLLMVCQIVFVLRGKNEAA